MTLAEAVERDHRRRVVDALNLRAYLAGFAEGADLQKIKRGRHAVDPSTHEHWRRGVEDGRGAARLAREQWIAELAAGKVGSR